MAFVGRHPEMTMLRASLDEADRGAGLVVMLAGEAGIGKTRTCEELSLIADARGFRVVRGRAYEAEGTPPFWPWIQALREHVAEGLSKDIEALMGLRREASTHHDPETARFRLFDRIARLLRDTTAKEPLLVVLEDLHWADKASLLLLEFLAHELVENRVLIVGTYRDVELTRTHPLNDTLAEVARARLRTIPLRGLGRGDVRRLLSDSVGTRPPETLVQSVHEQTEGNPFFVIEVAALLGQESSPGEEHLAASFAIPETVKAVIARRVNRLSDRSQDLLATASVIGREFDLPLLENVRSDLEEEELLGSIDEARRAHVVHEFPGVEERYQFRHALIRRVLYDDLSSTRRMQWHLQIADNLERMYGEERSSQLAHHFAQAGRLASPGKLLRHSVIAGSRALAAHAHEDALGHFELAWKLKRDRTADDESAEILFGLGCAESAATFRWNRQIPWEYFCRAIDYYLETGHVDRAVMVTTHPSITPEGADGVAKVVRRVLEGVAPGSSGEGWLQARLAAGTYFETGDYRGACRQMRIALTIAEKNGDDALELRALTHGVAMDHYQCRWTELIAKGRRVIELAREVDDLPAENYARYRIALVLMHLGRREEAKREAQVNVERAEVLRDRGLLQDAYWVSTGLSYLEGDWERARAFSDRALDLSPYNSALLHARMLVECEVGNFEAAIGYLERLFDVSSYSRAYPLRAAWSSLALPQVARRAGERPSFQPIAIDPPVAPMPLSTAMVDVGRALTALEEKDLEAVEDTLNRLAPMKGAIIAPFLVTDRLLGRMAHSLGQSNRAIRFFEEALRFCRNAPYPCELAWTCYDYAPVLLKRDRRGDRQKAAALLEEALDIAETLGMRPLARLAASFRERYRAKLAHKPGGLSRRELDVLELLAAGLTNKAIAEQLFISTNTVAVHVAHILQKTRSANRTEAANYAIRNHLDGSPRDRLENSQFG